MGDVPTSDARTQGPFHWELIGAQGLLHLGLSGTTDFGTDRVQPCVGPSRCQS